LRWPDRSAVQPAAPPQHRVLAPELCELARERDELVVAVLPVEPRDLGVLAIAVVVAVLGAAHLVAAEQHRYALRQEQRREEVALLAPAQPLHLRIVGRTLDTAVPRSIVVLAALLAVRRVVLLVVGDEIVEREAVVRGDEVDARVREPAV